MKKRALIFLFACLWPATSGFSETFRFQYEAGEMYRILSRVDEEVSIDGRFAYEAEILNRIAVTVERVENNAGWHTTVFETSERIVGQNANTVWSEEYDSDFWRDALGVYRIEDRFFMPVVRNVPVFPERDLAAGAVWTAQGEEVHDFRESLGIPDAYHFPVTVNYRYEGPTTVDGQEYHLIRISYNFSYRPTASQRRGQRYPVRIAGNSEQVLIWDNRLGRPYSYEEDFNFLLNLSSGESFEFSGTASAAMISATRLDRPSVAETIRERIEDSGIQNVTVTEDDRGVTISLENIYFQPNSDTLGASELPKLEEISRILSQYPDRNLLVTGHTARLGAEDVLQDLSERRARSVADYLVENGVRSEDEVVVRGYGSSRPVTGNDTEEGRGRNRRVEITILEN